MTSRTVLIDGDIIAFTAAANVDYAMDWGDGFYTSMGDLHQAMALVTARIEEISKSFNNAHPTVALSCDGNYWRHDIYPAYKGNRTTIKPVVLKALREEMQKVYECVMLPKLEADDVLGIFATSGVLKDPIVFSEDKDLDSIPCYRARKPGLLYKITPAEADYNHLVQAFTGDPTDGYPGCPGIGPKTAAKILAPLRDGTRDLLWAWELIVAKYDKQKKTYDEALTMARLARILRHGEYDADLAAVDLWMPPKPAAGVVGEEDLEC